MSNTGNNYKSTLLLTHDEVALLEALVARETFLSAGMGPETQDLMDRVVLALVEAAGPAGIVGLLARLGKAHRIDHEVNGAGSCPFPAEMITDELLAKLLACVTPPEGAP